MNWVGNDLTIISHGACGDFQLDEPNWPDTPGSGTAVSWSAARTAQAVPVYWIAAYSYYGALQVDLIGHPSQGGNFADDTVPSVLDPIEDFGSLGLNGATGYNPDPYQAPTGACCLPSGSCVSIPLASCIDQGGVFQGFGEACQPSPCTVGFGACCIPGLCAVLTQQECSGVGGNSRVEPGAGHVADAQAGRAGYRPGRRDHHGAWRRAPDVVWGKAPTTGGRRDVCGPGIRQRGDPRDFY